MNGQSVYQAVRSQNIYILGIWVQLFFSKRITRIQRLLVLGRIFMVWLMVFIYLWKSNNMSREWNCKCENSLTMAALVSD